MTKSLPTPTAVEARPGYRLHVAFSDGVHGEIDLSDLVGHGVFAPLADISEFEQVYIGESRQIAWNSELEICADAIYAELSTRAGAEATHA